MDVILEKGKKRERPKDKGRWRQSEKSARQAEEERAEEVNGKCFRV